MTPEGCNFKNSFYLLFGLISNYSSVVSFDKSLKLYFALVPSKVHNMRVRAVGSSTFFVTWEKCRQPNGAIRGYFIEFEGTQKYLHFTPCYQCAVLKFLVSFQTQKPD